MLPRRVRRSAGAHGRVPEPDGRKTGLSDRIRVDRAHGAVQYSPGSHQHADHRLDRLQDGWAEARAADHAALALGAPCRSASSLLRRWPPESPDSGSTSTQVSLKRSPFPIAVSDTSSWSRVTNQPDFARRQRQIPRLTRAMKDCTIETRYRFTMLTVFRASAARGRP